MTQSVNYGVIFAAVTAYVFVVILSQLAWWSKKAYFPSLELCTRAHDRFHLSHKEREELGDDPAAIAAAQERFWHVIAARLISQVPEELSISGFFCTLAWPLFVLLNILLLAQVVGTMVGEGGGVWEIYPFGTYGAIPLVTATLYALAQTVAGIMYGESKDKKRYLALAFLTLAILLEGGLAIYRAALIREGGTAAGVNLVDHSLESQFGLVVGGFFGIFFPATHAALGYVAFPKFIVPVIRYGFRLSGGIFMLLWSAANYVSLAWHPQHPRDWVVVPGSERALWDEQRRLLANANTLAADLKLLADDLPSTPGTVVQLLYEARALRSRWIAITAEANELLSKATNLSFAAAMAASGDGGKATAPRLTPLYRLADSHDKLMRAIESIQTGENELHLDGQPQGQVILKRLATCRVDLIKLQQRLETIQGMAHQGMDADGLLGGCKNALSNLSKAFDAIPEPAPGDLRFPDYQKLRDLVARCQAAYERLTDRWRKTKPAIPPADELKARRDELDSLSDLTQTYTDTSKSLFETKEILLEELKRVERRPSWFYWLADRIA
jgi:hypothetical protein